MLTLSEVMRRVDGKEFYGHDRANKLRRVKEIALAVARIVCAECADRAAEKLITVNLSDAVSKACWGVFCELQNEADKEPGEL